MLKARILELQRAKSHIKLREGLRVRIRMGDTYHSVH